MSTPQNSQRCCHDRYHSDPATCERCEEIQERKEQARRSKTPWAEFDEEFPEPPIIRKGRGRRPRSTDPDAEHSSPLAGRSTRTSGGGGLLSPRATQEQEEDEPEILVPATPMSDNLQPPPPSPSPSPSTQSTQLVPDTPLDQLRGPNNREASPTATEIVAQGIEVAKQEIKDLRASRNRLAQNLEESTAARESHRERQNQMENELHETRQALLRAEVDRHLATDRDERHRIALLGNGSVSRAPADRILAAALVFLIWCIVAYVLWCWHKSPEMEYIRKRREEVLRE